jgi:hypothetical protein
MDYISSIGLHRCLATAAIALLLQPAYAQQQAFTEPPLFLEHDLAMQPVDTGTADVSDYAQGSRRHSADRKLPPQQPDLTFGEYRSWEVGVGTRKSVGVMIKRDFH